MITLPKRQYLGSINQTIVYNPRLLFTLASNPELFQSKIPVVIKELIVSKPSDIEGSKAQHRQAHMHLSAKNLWEYGHEILFNEIYAHYQLFMGKNYKRLEDLDVSERQDWEDYFKLGNLAKEEAVKILKSLTRFELPDMSSGSFVYAEAPKTYFLYSRLLSVPHKLILNIIPDLTDQEAAVIFGHPNTANDVYWKSIDPVETQPLF